VASLLGTVGGILFAFSGDIPEISALDNYHRTRSHACSLATSASSASSPSSGAS
jgi:hypothetical protein